MHVCSTELSKLLHVFIYASDKSHYIIQYTTLRLFIKFNTIFVKFTDYDYSNSQVICREPFLRQNLVDNN